MVWRPGGRKRREDRDKGRKGGRGKKKEKIWKLAEGLLYKDHHHLITYKSKLSGAKECSVSGEWIKIVNSNAMKHYTPWNLFLKNT